MTRHFLPATAVAVALMLLHHSMIGAKPTSNVVDLGTLGGGFSDAFGINNDPSSGAKAIARQWLIVARNV